MAANKVAGRSKALSYEVRIALFTLFLFLSGSSALVFETLWLRLSGLVFGNSVWSAALVLSSFMGGLALGNAIAARTRRQPIAPLRLYALLEVIIAVAGCAIIFALPSIGAWMRPIFRFLWNHDDVLNGIRLVAAFVILLVPTTAMGLTLPVVLDDVAVRRHDFARALGLLYGANTLGAVAGALIGEAFLVRLLGLWGASLAAAGLSFTAAAIALVLAKDLSRAEQTSLRQTSWARMELTRLPWRLLFISFSAGGIFLCLEMVWFRFLRLYVASSSSAFAMMLAVVLAGIGLGGVISGTIPKRIAESKQFVPILLMGAAMATLLSYILFPGPSLQRRAGAFYLDSWTEVGLLSFALMLPVALLTGVLFPSIVSRVQASVENRMNSIGVTTLFNTTGAALGPLMASFILLPNIGFQWTLIVCAVVYLLLAMFLSDQDCWSLKQPLGRCMIGLGATVILLIVFFPYHRDEEHFAAARRPFETDGSHLFKRIEGNCDTYQLLRRDHLGQPYYYRLTTNAFSMASTESRNQRYMRSFAYLPLTFRPESEEALLICYGCGVTADALVHSSKLKRIDIVDISKEVLTLANFYLGPNHPNALHDPRVTTFVQDGRFFLQASSHQYDVITGEPPPPKVAGTVNLYTEQFFSLMNSRLKEGGIATFWLPIYELTVDETKAILRGFHNVFSNASIWANADHEWIMMGIKGQGRRLQEEELRHMWSDPVTASDLARVGLEGPEQMAALFVMDAREIDRITSGVKPLTDFYPKRLSDISPDIEEARNFAWPYMEASSAFRAFLASPLIEAIWPETIRRSVGPFFVFREARYLSEIKGSNKLAELDLYLRHSRLRTPVLEALRTDEFRISIAKDVATKSGKPSPEAIADLVAAALADRDVSRAIRLLEEKKAQGAAVRNDVFLLIYLQCLNGNVNAAEALASLEMRSTEKDWFVDWLWGKLQAEFGFRPPA